MRSTVLALVALVTTVLLAPRTAVAVGCEPVLFGAAHSGGPAAPSTLYRIDPVDGSATPLGPIGYNAVGGMDFDPVSGLLFAVGSRPSDFEAVLLAVDPYTGAGREIGPLGTVRRGPFDISFRNADGVLFALAFSLINPCSSLYTIDPITGAATEIDDTTTCASGDALGFDPTDALYQANNTSGGSLFIVDQILGISTLADTLRYIGFPSLSDPRPNAMDFDPATGDAFVSVNDGLQGAGPNYLASLDISTGRVTRIGQTVDGLDALAYGTLRFGPLLEASGNNTDLTWPDPLDYLFVKGPLVPPGGVGAYGYDLSGSGTGTVFSDPTLPAAGEGLWYLLRPDCPGGTWTSGGPGECAPAGACPAGGRDGALP